MKKIFLAHFLNTPAPSRNDKKMCKSTRKKQKLLDDTISSISWQPRVARPHCVTPGDTRDFTSGMCTLIASFSCYQVSLKEPSAISVDWVVEMYISSCRYPSHSGLGWISPLRPCLGTHRLLKGSKWFTPSRNVFGNDLPRFYMKQFVLHKHRFPEGAKLFT